MKSLQLLDNVEEWVEGIPDGWVRVQLKHVATKLDRPVEPKHEIVICTNKGTVIPRGDNNPGLVSLSGAGYQGVKPGDLLIHGMDTWHGAIAVSQIEGQCTSVVHVCDSSQEKRFLAYYLRALAFRAVYKAFSNGVRQNTSDFRSWAKAGEIPVILPPLDEQRRIADFLDEKCAEIDRAVSAAERSIEEYKAHKNSIVNQIITKGLNSDVPMKDSGVEWLGEVPAEWALRQAGQLADQTKVPNEGMIETNLLSLSYGKVKRRDINATDGLLPASFETYNVIEPNDIVLRFTDLQNDQKSLRVGRATERGIITSAYVAVRPLNPSYSRFMYYALHAYDLRKGFYGMGAGVRQGLKWQEAKYIKLPWPGDVERDRIADFLDEKCDEIDDAIAAKWAIITDLKSYKKSLIYEIATGKREV